MIAFVKRLWAAAPLATLVLAVALTAAGVFAVRSAAFFVYWHDPAHREQQVEAWMTPGYIAHSWQVPRRVILDALDAPVPPPHGPMSLRAFAELNAVPLEDVIAEAEAAIAAFRAERESGGHGDRRP